MAITKQKKTEILKKLQMIVKDSNALVFANFKGLTVADVSIMRRELKAKNVGYFVAKKTLISKALKEGGFQGELPSFEGELAIAYGADVLEPISGVYEFQKKFDKRISIVGGVFEKTFTGKERMLELATIPSLKTLRGMFVNLINSPIQRVVIALDQISKNKPVA